MYLPVLCLESVIFCPVRAQYGNLDAFFRYNARETIGINSENRFEFCRRVYSRSSKFSLFFFFNFNLSENYNIP